VKKKEIVYSTALRENLEKKRKREKKRKKTCERKQKYDVRTLLNWDYVFLKPIVIPRYKTTGRNTHTHRERGREREGKGPQP